MPPPSGCWKRPATCSRVACVAAPSRTGAWSTSCFTPTPSTTNARKDGAEGGIRNDRGWAARNRRCHPAPGGRSRALVPRGTARAHPHEGRTPAARCLGLVRRSATGRGRGVENAHAEAARGRRGDRRPGRGGRVRDGVRPDGRRPRGPLCESELAPGGRPWRSAVGQGDGLRPDSARHDCRTPDGGDDGRVRPTGERPGRQRPASCQDCRSRPVRAARFASALAAPAGIILTEVISMGAVRVAALSLVAGAAALAATPPPYGAAGPLAGPVLFGEGVLSTGEFESHPAFTPDGRTLYFVKSTPAFTDWTILVTQWGDGRWSPAKAAPFSGRHRDADPFVTADGKRLYFISDRPVDGKPKTDMDIWVMERKGRGDWGEPRNLGAPVNTKGNEWLPRPAANGTLYFGSDRPGGSGRTDLYRARRLGDR